MDSRKMQEDKTLSLQATKCAIQGKSGGQLLIASVTMNQLGQNGNDT